MNCGHMTRTSTGCFICAQQAAMGLANQQRAERAYSIDGTSFRALGEVPIGWHHVQCQAEAEQLRKQWEATFEQSKAGWRRANELGDKCGHLQTQVRDLEVENSRLRREVERLTRRR